jgi:MFS family permease
MGLLPDGETPSLGETAPGEAAPGGPSTAMRQGPLAVDRWRTAYRSAPIWQLTFSYVVCGITTSGMAVHFVPYAVDKGISTSTAALAFGLLNLINLAGVIGVGFWSDRLLRKNVLAVIYAVRGLAFLLLVFLPAGVGLWAFAIVGGASWLATVSQTSALTAEIYGVKRAGTLTGMLTMIHQFGGAAAVLAAGAIFTWLGTYTPFFLFAAGALVFASVMSWTVRERSSSVRFVVDGDVSGGLAAERA